MIMEENHDFEDQEEGSELNIDDLKEIEEESD